MHSFLVKLKKPLVKWTHLKDNTFFEGTIPEGYDLAVCPSEGMVILDVDKHGKKNGFEHIPPSLMFELKSTLNYPTKNSGRHFFFHYTGDKLLANTHSKYGIDLRTNRGYVVYYPANQGDDIRNHLDEIKDSSKEMNLFLEEAFTHHKQKK